MTNDNADIVEVVECGHKYANIYLASGYRFLGVDVEAVEIDRRAPMQGQPEATTYIRRRSAFVVGRPEDVSPVDAGAVLTEQRDTEAPA